MLQLERKSKAKNYLLEIRHRFFYILFSFICTFATAYFYSTWLFYLFLLSYFNYTKSETPNEIRFIFTDVHEAFASTIYVCLVFSLFVVAPLGIYMCLVFLTPSLHKTEAQQVGFYVVSVFLLWLIFMLSIQFVVLPKLCFFFLQFKVESSCLLIGVETRIHSYLDWVSNMFMFFTIFYFFVCACIILVVHYKMNPFLLSHRRSLCAWLLLICAAFFSPPDIVSEFFIAGLLWCSFEILLFLYFVYYQFKKKCTEQSSVQTLV